MWEPIRFVGLIYHWIGGFASATNFIPFRQIRRWSWEVYWIIQGFAAWIVAPIVLASIFVPHVFPMLGEAYRAHPRAMQWAFVFGVLWGVGGITFGLAIRYLGIALGYAIALGLCAFFGTLVPPFVNRLPPLNQREIFVMAHATSGKVILLGVLVCVLGVAVNGAAGYWKERELTPEAKAEAGERDYNFAKGIMIAILAGFMSSFFAFGLAAGKPLGDIAKAQLAGGGTSGSVAEPADPDRGAVGRVPDELCVVGDSDYSEQVGAAVCGGAGHRIRCGRRTRRGRRWRTSIRGTRQSLRLSGRALFGNYVFAAMAGVIWYFQFFFYSMGQTKMGKYDFSSWTLHMASIIIFATLWGLVLHEWRGTSRTTKLLVTLGLALLIGSTVVVGYGNYLKVQETAAVAAAQR